MTSTPAPLPAAYLLFAFLCGPPFLSLLICLRRLRYQQRRGRGGKLLVVGIVFSAAAFLFNSGTTFITTFRIARDEVTFGRVHVVALALAWLCFWIWISALVFRARRKRNQVY